MSQSVRSKISEIFIKWNLPTRQVAIIEIVRLFEERLSGLEMEEEQLVKGYSNFDMIYDVNQIKEERNGIIREFNTKLQLLKAQLQEETKC